jgi:hypothetical protein
VASPSAHSHLPGSGWAERDGPVVAHSSAVRPTDLDLTAGTSRAAPSRGKQRCVYPKCFCRKVAVIMKCDVTSFLVVKRKMGQKLTYLTPSSCLVLLQKWYVQAYTVGPLSYNRLDIRTTWVTTKLLSYDLRAGQGHLSYDPHGVHKLHSEPRYACLWT